jgi:dTDP-glucose 4,6-dehydratase/UDP-glucose 4-epimerase
MAGQTSHMDSMSDPFTDLEINAHAQLAILEAVRRFNPKVKLIFASTRQLYGRPNYLPVDEKHPVRPVDINGINKNAGEQFHLLYHNVYGIKTSVLRLTNTYGPGMRIKDARQTFVGLWIKNVIQNNIFEVWGGNQMRDFNYVEDVVDAFLVAAISKDSEGEIFNLGSSEIINLKDLANKLIEINGYGDFFEMNFPEDRKKIDIGDYYSDFSKITSTLGWKPSTSLNKGLKKSLEFYKNDGESYFD